MSAGGRGFAAPPPQTTQSLPTRRLCDDARMQRSTHRHRTTRATRRTVAALLLVAALVAAGCSSSDDDLSVAEPAAAEVLGEAVTPADADEAADGSADAEASSTATVPAGFTVQPSLEQLAVLDAAEGTSLELVLEDGTVVASGVADAFGSLLWRDVEPGTYLVRTARPPATPPSSSPSPPS